MPDFSIEQNRAQAIIGFDEAGRGPIAGPVVAACVYVPSEKRDLDFWMQVNDSKKLSKPLRNQLFKEIQAHCVFGIGQASAAEIDEINILQASFLAMARAYDDLKLLLSSRVQLRDLQSSQIPPCASLSRNDNQVLALIDGNRLPKTFPISAECLTKGDSKSLSIAAASILAKVTRDRIMEGLAIEHPHYGWQTNSAYPTKAHLEALNIHGVTPYHRKSFAPVRKMIAAQALAA